MKTILKVNIEKEKYNYKEKEIKTEILQQYGDATLDELAEDLSIIIDRIIMDIDIKVRPNLVDLETPNPDMLIYLIQERRKKVCEAIMNAEVSLEYIKSDKTSSYIDKMINEFNYSQYAEKSKDEP